MLRERRAEDGDWQFRVERNEVALYDLLSEEDRQGLEFYGQTGNAPSFQEALRLLDKYPWPNLHPIQVHPQFVEAVLLEVNKRTDADTDDAFGTP